MRGLERNECLLIAKSVKESHKTASSIVATPYTNSGIIKKKSNEEMKDSQGTIHV